MALDFPTSPTDGQIYDNYYWDNTNSRWMLLGSALEVWANFSNTATGTYTDSVDGFDYKYVSFTSDGTLNLTRGGLIEYLVIGGGGSGAAGNDRSAGGGGAGGYRCNVSGENTGGGFLAEPVMSIPAGNYDVIVGDGGASVVTAGGVSIPGLPGSLSRLDTIIAGGGGAGTGYSLAQNLSLVQHGASGGGSGGDPLGGSGSSLTIVGGAGAVGQGFDGGAGQFSTTTGTNQLGGGGGGASEAGAAATVSNAGDGGDGVASRITGTSVTRAGGGGGVNRDASDFPGAGGAGGGGAGVRASNAVSGTANTGSGGGATSGTTGLSSGAGGSGIVIVRVRTN